MEPLRLLVLGDIVGAPGRLAVSQCLSELRERYRTDWVVANAENVDKGTGLKPEQYRKLVQAGVDAMTLGDHVYKKKQITSVLQQESNLIRPANLPPGAAGKTWMRLDPSRTAGGEEGVGVYVLTVLGRLYMGLPANDPFAAVEAVLARLPERNPIVLVEVHAETTSEKQALGWYLNGRVACVFGTHTHTPTADARLLPNDVSGGGGALGGGGTAYISDLGMCGPHDSVLGRRVDRVLAHMTTAMPHPFDVAEGNPRLNGIYLEIDRRTRRATAIERIEQPADVTRPPFAAGRG